jgi:hypothetical protein
VQPPEAVRVPTRPGVVAKAGSYQQQLQQRDVGSAHEQQQEAADAAQPQSSEAGRGQQEQHQQLQARQQAPHQMGDGRPTQASAQEPGSVPGDRGGLLSAQAAVQQLPPLGVLNVQGQAQRPALPAAQDDEDDDRDIVLVNVRPAPPGEPLYVDLLDSSDEE